MFNSYKMRFVDIKLLSACLIALRFPYLFTMHRCKHNKKLSLIVLVVAATTYLDEKAASAVTINARTSLGYL